MLGSQLRQATGALHAQIERHVFIATLLKGRLPQPAYCAMLRNLHVLYEALESALARPAAHAAPAAPAATAAPAAIDPALLTVLARAPALASDLAVLHGPAWAHALPVLPAAQAYAERMAMLADIRPVLLAAHAYVRYLGDLSGGQMLRRIVGKSLHLPDGAGTAFYDFGPPATVQALAGQFRAGLDAIAVGTGGSADAADAADAKNAGKAGALDESGESGNAGNASTHQAIVDEALHAFAMHGQLFDELADACGLARRDGLSADHVAQPSQQHRGALGRNIDLLQ